MINPFIILLVGSALPKFYAKYKHFTIPYQFSVGVILAGVSMITLWFGAEQAYGSGIVNANYVGLSYLLVTIAELFVSAVGLSMIGLYCHPKMIAFAMGAWYLASSMSNLISGQLGELVAVPKGSIDKISSLHAYANYFLDMGMVAILVGIALCFVMYTLQTSLSKRDISMVC